MSMTEKNKLIHKNRYKPQGSGHKTKEAIRC
jgi:hypothetical protein